MRMFPMIGRDSIEFVNNGPMIIDDNNSKVVFIIDIKLDKSSCTYGLRLGGGRLSETLSKQPRKLHNDYYSIESYFECGIIGSLPVEAAPIPERGDNFKNP
jgi:hypothetical protein